jgi:hypothetical protein
MHLNTEQAETKCKQASSPRPYLFGGVVLGQCTELHLKLSITVEVQQVSNSTGRAGGRRSIRSRRCIVCPTKEEQVPSQGCARCN